MQKVLCIVVVLTAIACRQKKSSTAPLQPDYVLGESLIGTKNDSAYFYFNRALSTAKDSLETATAYGGMAIAQSDAGDYFGSQESATTSLKYLDENNPDHHYAILSNYNELGITSMNLNQFSAAVDYYDRLLPYLKDNAYRPIALNNKALALQKNGDYQKAIDIYESVLPQTTGDKKEYARILSNLARTRWQLDPQYNAAPDMLAALHWRDSADDNWGRNASYAHLSDFYAAAKPDSALYYARKMDTVSRLLNSPDDRLEALEKLIKLAPSAEAKATFHQFEKLGDSINTARNAAKNQFAAIRYGVEKSKADNLRLQNDNTKKQTYLYLLALSFLFAATLAWIWQRKREQQQVLRAKNELQNLRLKTSRKLHDTIANGLYRLMNGVEHSETLPREAILDQLEALYDQSRNMSYEEDIVPVDFDQAIVELVNQFDNPANKISVVGNNADLWNPINDEQKNELKLVLQELLVNMKKHAEAKFVVFRFERNNQSLNIYYTDDGVGIPPDRSFGNGLTNTENRISSLGGSINFDRSTDRGLKIHLHLPIQR